MPTWEDVYAELLAEFKDNCPPPLSDGAAAFFRSLLERNLRVLIEEGRIQWQGREQKFSLAAAAGLGRLSHEKVGTGTISEEVLREATTELIPYWERICPLPPVDGVSALLRACVVTRQLLSMTHSGAD
jgi:hypothetical protein